MMDSGLDQARLCFLRTPGASIALHRKLLSQIPSLGDVFGHSPAFYESLGIRQKAAEWLGKPDWGLVSEDAETIASLGSRLLWYEDRQYPLLLAETAAAPVALHVRGCVDVLAMPQVAIVGSRHPGHGGRGLAAMFARGLAERGYCITSGFAQGIDACAHHGVLQVKGRTLAVFGCGVDYIYPRGHEALAAAILANGGALVSEMPPGSAPMPSHFPRRNRIISGLALGTLVVEAAIRSGSLITARMAADQGREVFAVPGSILDPRSRGCHWLIRQGAKLVETIEDILHELPPLPAIISCDDPCGFQADHQGDAIELLSHIAYGPVTVDTLVVRTGLPASLLGPWLTRLELEGRVMAVPGGAYILAGFGGYGVCEIR